MKVNRYEDDADGNAVEAHLQLRSGDVISGTVGNGLGDPKPFHGWLELMDELDAIRSSSHHDTQEV
jgi:hypothetical protein